MEPSRSPSLYGYPVVGRFGLGHSLLAWARCIVWCHMAGAKPIAPQWLQPRIGPYLRNERDKRFYAKLFRSGRQIGGVRRMWLLATAKRSTIGELEAASRAQSLGQVASVVVFRNRNSGNEAAHFHEIVGHSALVREALIDMTRRRYHPPELPGPHVAIHVRGGDFASPSSAGDILSGRHNIRLPLDWYLEMLTGLRERIGDQLPAIVYSDCSDDELGALLRLPAVMRSSELSAVTDMLAMGQASCLISSGSGFSRWGSYLGQVPRLCHPGQRAIRVLGPPAARDLEPECATTADIPDELVQGVRRRLHARLSPVQ